MDSGGECGALVFVVKGEAAVNLISFLIGALRGKAAELVDFVAPSVIVVPAVLKGPDFHLDAHIYEKGGGITGSLYHGSEKLTLRLEGDMTRPFFFRCLLGEYSGAYSRPNIEKLKRLAEGEGGGRPLVLIPVGRKFRAEFSFDTGPSLDEFHVTYDHHSQLLSVSGEVFATCWDGDGYRPSAREAAAKALPSQAFLARCRELRDIREKMIELVALNNMEEAQDFCRVLVKEVASLSPPNDYESYHRSLVSLSNELSFWALTGQKRDSVDRLLDEVRLGELGYLG